VIGARRAHFTHCQRRQPQKKFLGRRSLILLLGEDEVHHPAAAHMRPRRTQMFDNVNARAARFLQRVGQNGEPRAIQLAAWQGAVIVGGLRDLHDGAVVPRAPGGIDGDGAEWVAEDVSQVDRWVGRVLPDRSRDLLGRDMYEGLRVVAEGGVPVALT
jgi:hypothetical protein